MTARRAAWLLLVLAMSAGAVVVGASTLLAVHPARPGASARLTQATGHATGVGREGRGGLQIVGVVEGDAFDLSSASRVSIAHLLDESAWRGRRYVGAGELVEGVPLALEPDGTPTDKVARFSTPARTRPVVELVLGARSPGELTFRLTMTGASIRVPELCPRTPLLTSLAVHGPGRRALLLVAEHEWHCAERGGAVEYLRLP